EIGIADAAVDGAMADADVSRGRADERAFHLLPDALNGAAADAALARDLAYAFAATQMRLDALFHSGIDRALEASVDALPDHAALKLGERTGPKSTIEGQRFSDLDLEGISVHARNYTLTSCSLDQSRPWASSATPWIGHFASGRSIKQQTTS